MARVLYERTLYKSCVAQFLSSNFLFHNILTSSFGEIANIIGCLGGYAGVDQPLPLLLSGCGSNADDIFDMEPHAVTKQKLN